MEDVEMLDKDLHGILEKTIRQDQTAFVSQKLKYVMDFGEVTIQYDFFLN